MLHAGLYIYFGSSFQSLKQNMQWFLIMAILYAWDDQTWALLEHIFFSFTYIMQTNFHIHLTWWCGLVGRALPQQCSRPRDWLSPPPPPPPKPRIQICFKSDALGKMPSTLRISLKYISIKNDQKITNAHSMNFYTGQLWYTLTSNPWGGGNKYVPRVGFLVTNWSFAF